MDGDVEIDLVLHARLQRPADCANLTSAEMGAGRPSISTSFLSQRRSDSCRSVSVIPPLDPVRVPTLRAGRGATNGRDALVRRIVWVPYALE